MLNNIQQLDINKAIKDSKVQKKEIAKQLGITPQWLSNLLAKPMEEWSLKQIKTITSLLGYDCDIFLYKRFKV